MSVPGLFCGTENLSKAARTSPATAMVTPAGKQPIGPAEQAIGGQPDPFLLGHRDEDPPRWKLKSKRRQSVYQDRIAALETGLLT